MKNKREFILIALILLLNLFFVSYIVSNAKSSELFTWCCGLDNFWNYEECVDTPCFEEWECPEGAIDVIPGKCGSGKDFMAACIGENQGYYYIMITYYCEMPAKR